MLGLYIFIAGSTKSIVKRWCFFAGHNRYGICQKHNFQFKTIEREFDSKDDACIWIIDNQKGRRNLPLFVKV
jgi:hypothetical protein